VTTVNTFNNSIQSNGVPATSSSGPIQTQTPSIITPGQSFTTKPTVLDVGCH
jgi:hypothetical protein